MGWLKRRKVKKIRKVLYTIKTLRLYNNGTVFIDTEEETGKNHYDFTFRPKKFIYYSKYSVYKSDTGDVKWHVCIGTDAYTGVGLPGFIEQQKYFRKDELPDTWPNYINEYRKEINRKPTKEGATGENSVATEPLRKLQDE